MNDEISTPEPDDVEGHGIRGRGFTEDATDEVVERGRTRLTDDTPDDDVDGHAMRGKA